MQDENRTKTFFMVLGLAAFVSLGAACMGLLGGETKGKATPAAATPCEGLEGQARTDCETSRPR